MSDTEKWKHVCVLMSLAVIGLLCAVGIMANHPPVIVVSPECEQSAYNNGPNYRYRAIRYRWRHV